MDEVMVDLRKYDLADRLGVDMISIDKLLSELEDALDTIDNLKEEIRDFKNPSEPDDYDIWHDRKLMEE